MIPMTETATTEGQHLPPLTWGRWTWPAIGLAAMLLGSSPFLATRPAPGVPPQPAPRQDNPKNLPDTPSPQTPAQGKAPMIQDKAPNAAVGRIELPPADLEPSQTFNKQAPERPPKSAKPSGELEGPTSKLPRQ
jgi:hypothetical protein